MPLVLILTKHFKNRFNQMIKYTLYPLRDFPAYLDRGISVREGGGVFIPGGQERQEVLFTMYIQARA